MGGGASVVQHFFGCNLFDKGYSEGRVWQAKGINSRSGSDEDKGPVRREPTSSTAADDNAAEPSVAAAAMPDLADSDDYDDPLDGDMVIEQEQGESPGVVLTVTHVTGVTRHGRYADAESLTKAVTDRAGKNVRYMLGWIEGTGRFKGHDWTRDTLAGGSMI